MAAVGHGETIDLGLDVDALFSVSLEPSNVNLNIKMTNASKAVKTNKVIDENAHTWKQ